MMNDIKDLTGGRLDADAVHDAAKPQDAAPHNEASPLDDATRRRAAYTRLADGFIAMMNVRAMLVEGCEIENGLEQRVTLDDALLAHFDALVIHADFFNPRTIAKFYVDLRMHGDELTPPLGLPAST